jgi:hypothetical protein
MANPMIVPFPRPGAVAGPGRGYFGGRTAGRIRGEISERELEGHTTESYAWYGPCCVGMAASSNRAVLQAGALSYLDRGMPLMLDQVQDLALRIERAWANGLSIAGQDIPPIVHGGAGETHTAASGSVAYVRVKCDAAWVLESVVVAYRPDGRRHHVADLLQSLVGHPEARSTVARISALARAASAAFAECDIRRLAASVSAYVSTFDAWTGGRLIDDEANRVAAGLQAALGSGFHGWKPLGGGSADGLLALVGAGTKAAALAYLESQGWVAFPAVVARGLDWRVDGAEVCFTAPYRIDFVGAADLGQSGSVGADGVCFGLAIEPRSELRLKVGSPPGHSAPGHQLDSWVLGDGANI